MNQLVSPNLDYPARAGYCLEYVDRAFGILSGEPTAWQAWLNTQFKHQDQNFPPLEFPVFFDGFHGEGHVAIQTPNGVCSSPPNLGQVGHVVFPSVDALAKAYGVTYVGWSEDLTNVRVIEEDEMSTIGDVEARILIKHIYGYTSEIDIEGAIPALLNGESNTIIRMMDATPTAAAYQKQIKEWQTQTPANIIPYAGPQLYEKK